MMVNLDREGRSLERLSGMLDVRNLIEYFNMTDAAWPKFTMSGPVHPVPGMSSTSSPTLGLYVAACFSVEQKSYQLTKITWNFHLMHDRLVLYHTHKMCI